MAIWVNRDGFNSQENHLNLAFGSCRVICLYDSVILLFCLASMRGLTCIPEDISVDGEGRKWECSFADHLLFNKLYARNLTHHMLLNPPCNFVR